MRVLVVDDETNFADGLRRGLEAEGFSSTSHTTGSTECGGRVRCVMTRSSWT